MSTIPIAATAGACSETSAIQSKNNQPGILGPPKASRHELPAERHSITHKFTLAGNEGYLTVGMYPNGDPGEISIVMAKEGSTAAGLLTSFAHAISIALQHGAPLKVLCEQFRYMRYEPSGWTSNPSIQTATSVTDYVFHWLQLRFLPETITVRSTQDTSQLSAGTNSHEDSPTGFSEGPLCRQCGSITQRSGTCYYCHNCGASTGCG